MKLWIVSDLHEDDARAYFEPPSDFDVFVCAGDLLTGDIEGSIERVASLAGGKPAVFVAGNHEWMTSSIEETAELGYAAAKRTGVHWLECDAVEIAGVRFAGATLWTPDDSRYVASLAVLLLDSKRPGIVVTHYEPPARLLTAHGTKLFVHGHKHGLSDRMVDGRRVIRNAYGYPLEQVEDAAARPDYVVEF